MKWFYVCLHHAIATHELYFVYKHDNYGGMGLSTIQKVVVACRYFTYGMVANWLDEYCYYIVIWKIIAMFWLKWFVKAMRDVFKYEYISNLASPCIYVFTTL